MRNRQRERERETSDIPKPHTPYTVDRSCVYDGVFEVTPGCSVLVPSHDRAGHIKYTIHEPLNNVSPFKYTRAPAISLSEASQISA